MCIYSEINIKQLNFASCKYAQNKSHAIKIIIACMNIHIHQELFETYYRQPHKMLNEFKRSGWYNKLLYTVKSLLPVVMDF